MRSYHFPKFGRSDIGLSLFTAGYNPSFERQITLACLLSVKNSPFEAHLLKRIFIMFKYSLGICFKRNADVPALSVDFFDLKLFHSNSTSFDVIGSSGILGVYSICWYF